MLFKQHNKSSPLNSTHCAMLYPQNGVRVVAIDSVTSPPYVFRCGCSHGSALTPVCELWNLVELVRREQGFSRLVIESVIAVFLRCSWNADLLFTDRLAGVSGGLAKQPVHRLREAVLF